MLVSLGIGAQIGALAAPLQAFAQSVALNGRVAQGSRDTVAVVRASRNEVQPIFCQLIFRLDGSTKWLVTFGQTAAVLLRHDIVSPFIIVGAIAAGVFTSVLKKILNQKRPSGAPFTDPGMPSSHALVSTFLGAAWSTYLHSAMVTLPLVAAAVSISVLRVVCGHHTWAQIGVGGVIGGLLGYLWMLLGAALVLPNGGPATRAAVYVVYLSGSVLFVHMQLLKKKIGKGAPVVG